MTLDLEDRTGWPDELRFLLDRYPRRGWPTHANLGALARVWLDIHDGFRKFGGTLAAATVELNEGRVTPERFRTWFGPRLRMFLSHLNGHHQIEDLHYFPLLGAAAEPRLIRGFEVLDKDHHVIHAAMDRLAETANTFLRIEPGDAERLRRMGDDYAAASDRLLRLLDRHLDDEEDLIVPLILDRGEEKLGM